MKLFSYQFGLNQSLPVNQSMVQQLIRFGNIRSRFLELNPDSEVLEVFRIRAELFYFYT